MRYPIGIVAVAFGGGTSIEDAAQRSADLGFDHLDASAPAVDRLDPAERGRFGGADRGSHRRVRGGRGLYVDGTLRAARRRQVSKRPSSCSARTPVPASSPGPAVLRRATKRSRRSSPRYRACASRSTPATWPPGAGSRSPAAPRGARAVAAGGGGRPQRHPDEGGDVDFAAVLAELDRLDYPGLMSIEYFDLADYGWPLDDPVGHAVALATHVARAHVARQHPTGVSCGGYTPSVDAGWLSMNRSADLAVAPSQ